MVLEAKVFIKRGIFGPEDDSLVTNIRAAAPMIIYIFFEGMPLHQTRNEWCKTNVDIL